MTLSSSLNRKLDYTQLDKCCDDLGLSSRTKGLRILLMHGIRDAKINRVLNACLNIRGVLELTPEQCLGVATWLRNLDANGAMPSGYNHFLAEHNVDALGEEQSTAFWRDVNASMEWFDYIWEHPDALTTVIKTMKRTTIYRWKVATQRVLFMRCEVYPLIGGFVAKDNN